MAISAKQVAELRRMTGAGMMDCKKALSENDGDMDKAVEYLQKKNLAAVAKRAGRVAAEGAIGAYVHGGRIGVLVEINSETDFVARNEDFQALLKDVSMHIAATNPRFLDDTEIPESIVEKQREIFLAQMADSGKPEAIMGKIIDGKLAKWKKEICLVDQPFVKDTDKTVGQHVTDVASRIKENIKIRRFVRFEVGEGIEKEETDFAAEVAAAAGS
ncbi:MAG: translation elongation factor Ts [Myxococcales bacterium]|nr:translation elongation factor Ts [Myxococcales bacterium]